MARIDASKLNLDEKVVQINRVSKVVQGGRRFSFSAVVVVGDGNGNVGAGIGKAGEVPEAIRNGVEDAKKHLIKVPLVVSTIPHEVHRGHRRHRRRLGEVRRRGGRHPRHPEQGAGLDEPDQRRARHDGVPRRAPLRRRYRRASWQDGRAAVG